MACNSMYESASHHCIAWNSPIALPNARLSFAYFIASSRLLSLEPIFEEI